MEYTEDEGQRLAAEFMAKLAARPVKATYDLATLGAKTRPNGTTYAGYTDTDGLCERVTTYRPEELTVWFGEDAEKKKQVA